MLLGWVGFLLFTKGMYVWHTHWQCVSRDAVYLALIWRTFLPIMQDSFDLQSGVTKEQTLKCPGCNTHSDTPKKQWNSLRFVPHPMTFVYWYLPCTSDYFDISFLSMFTHARVHQEVLFWSQLLSLMD